MQKVWFVVVSCGLFAGQASAETLYDFACCPNDDCQTSGIDQVTQQADGWHVASLDEVISFDDPRIRVSSDGQFHVCTRSIAIPGLSWSQVDQLSGARTLKCLYIPATS